MATYCAKKQVARSDFADQAEAQLDTAINWGRYAELFAYADDTAELYLEG